MYQWVTTEKKQRYEVFKSSIPRVVPSVNGMEMFTSFGECAAFECTLNIRCTEYACNMYGGNYGESITEGGI